MPNTPATDNAQVAAKIQNQISDKLMGAFDAVVAERNEHYRNSKGKMPGKGNTRSIVDWYANTNSVISGGMGLIPGPWGMLAVVPEIVLIIRNQIAMIYDIGMAYGKGNTLSREMLAAVLAYALGSSGIGILTMQGSKVLVRRASLRVFQQIIAYLSGKVTQQVLKATISKLLPFVGAAAMAAWSNYSTRQVAKRAIGIFEKDVIVSDEEVSDVTEEAAATGQATPTTASKAHILINLAKVDGKVTSDEVALLQGLLEKTDLPDEEKKALSQSLGSDVKHQVDYQIFANNPDDAIGLIADMTAVALRDEELHATERIYIHQVGKQLGIATGDIDALLDGALSATRRSVPKTKLQKKKVASSKVRKSKKSGGRSTKGVSRSKRK